MVNNMHALEWLGKQLEIDGGDLLREMVSHFAQRSMGGLPTPKPAAEPLCSPVGGTERDQEPLAGTEVLAGDPHIGGEAR